jgi:hypothetical protein
VLAFPSNPVSKRWRVCTFIVLVRESVESFEFVNFLLGAGDAIVGEPMVVVREYAAQWGKILGQDELANLSKSMDRSH